MSLVTWSGPAETAISTAAAEGRNGIKRVYDPHLGTFHRRDPLGELGEANVYRFVRNDSINGVDPLGLECTRSTDFHHVGLGSLAHKVIGPDNEFPWYRVVFFNYIRFPVNCLKCKKGKSPTVKVTATVTSSGVDKYDVKNDFQVITFDGGTCDKNGSAKVSVDTTMLLKLGKFINTWNAMVTLQRQVELCYDCVSCK